MRVMVMRKGILGNKSEMDNRQEESAVLKCERVDDELAKISEGDSSKSHCEQ